MIQEWDRRAEADSTRALAFYAFKREGLGGNRGRAVEPPPDLTEEQLLAALSKAAAWLRSSFGSLQVSYGTLFRVGREGGDPTWPVGGGSVSEAGMATVRAISFNKVGKVLVGRSGQTSTQIVVMTDPPESYSIPFAVILADDLIDGHNKSCLQQMTSVFKYHRSTVLGVEEVPKSDTDKYGIVKAELFGDRISRVNAIVEKPNPKDAPSNLAVVGRYILTPHIFELLETTERGAGGAIQLTDAIARLLMEEQVIAYQFQGTRYDCGSKLGYLMATVEYALKHKDLKDDFRNYLDSRFCQIPGSTKQA